MFARTATSSLGCQAKRQGGMVWASSRSRAEGKRVSRAEAETAAEVPGYLRRKASTSLTHLDLVSTGGVHAVGETFQRGVAGGILGRK